MNGGASPGPEESPRDAWAPKQEGSAAQAGHRLAALTGWAAQGGPVDPTALRQGAPRSGLPCPLGKLGTGAQHQLAALPGESIQRCWGWPGSPLSAEPVSSLETQRQEVSAQVCGSHPSSPESSRRGPCPSAQESVVHGCRASQLCAQHRKPEQGLCPAGADAES